MIKINSTVSAEQTFSFEHVARDEIRREIVNLDHTKASQDNYIPTKIIKANSDIICEVIYNDFNYNLVDNGIFTNNCQNSAKITSKFQYGFRKGFNAQDCLIVMIEKWKRMLDKGSTCGALLTDLSKAFDCFSILTTVS